MEAARAARSGKSLSEVISVAQSMIPRVKHFTGMHDLKFLSHVGRLHRSLAAKLPEAGNGLADIKTVISVARDTGQIEFIGKYQGLQKAMEEMIAGAKKHLDPNREAHFMVHYSVDINEIKPLKKMVEANFRCAELFVTQCTAVMTCSTGPQFGISFYS